jgi:hypothetical protein
MSEQANNDQEKLINLIEELWSRARINAFAHREATNKYSRKDSIWFLLTILFSLISILSIILSYITQNGEIKSTIFEIGFIKNLKSLDYALISIFATFVSLTTTIYSNHKRYSSISEQHKFIQNSYIHIAQRTRAAKNPTIRMEKLNALYDDLERDFADIKARGIEPQDEHFEKAHKIEKKRKKGKAPLSFDTKDYNQPEKETNTNIENRKWLGVWQCIKFCFSKENKGNS